LCARRGEVERPAHRQDANTAVKGEPDEVFEFARLAREPVEVPCDERVELAAAEPFEQLRPPRPRLARVSGRAAVVVHELVHDLEALTGGHLATRSPLSLDSLPREVLVV
jgi:hypothetical protein